MKRRKRKLLQRRWLFYSKLIGILDSLVHWFSPSSPRLRTEGRVGLNSLKFSYYLRWTHQTGPSLSTLTVNRCGNILYEMNESCRPLEMSQVMHKYPHFSSDKLSNLSGAKIWLKTRTMDDWWGLQIWWNEATCIRQDIEADWQNNSI